MRARRSAARPATSLPVCPARSSSLRCCSARTWIPLAVLAGIRGPNLLALALAWETPVAVSSYIMAQQAGADDQLAGQLVVISSVCCIPTVFLMIFILQSLALL